MFALGNHKHQISCTTVAFSCTTKHLHTGTFPPLILRTQITTHICPIHLTLTLVSQSPGGDKEEAAAITALQTSIPSPKHCWEASKSASLGCSTTKHCQELHYYITEKNETWPKTLLASSRSTAKQVFKARCGSTVSIQTKFSNVFKTFEGA